MAVTRRFADIDLSRLPDLPAMPGYDAIYTARMAEISDRLNAAGIPYNVGASKTDTYAITEAVGAYRERAAYASVDANVRAVLLATSKGPHLDHLGATQVPPVRRLAVVAEPRPYQTNPEDWELDGPFRERVQLAPEALTTCGSDGAYLFFALSADGVKTAQVYGPMSYGGTRAAPFTPLGEVHIPIVAVAGDGAASPELVAAVQAAVSPDLRRPIGDFVTVSAAEIVPYRIEAVLIVGGGADPSAVAAAARQRLQAQADRQHRPGAAQLRQMLYGAAYVADATGAILVEEVDLIAPAADINGGAIGPGATAAAYRAPYCTEIVVRVEVADG